MGAWCGPQRPDRQRGRCRPGGGSLGVIENGVVQHPAVQRPVAALGLLLRFGLVYGLRKEIHAHLQPRVAGIGEVLFEHGVLDQVSRSAVAPVADADDDEAHAGFFDLVPVQPGLILGHVDAKGHVVLLYAVGVKIIQLAVNGAQTGDLFCWCPARSSRSCRSRCASRSRRVLLPCL